MSALLALEGLEAGYGPIRAVRSVSLHVDPGEIVAVIGANGSGKTTTLMCCSGIVPIAGGDIRFQGDSLRAVPAHRIAARGLAHVPEGRRIFGGLSVMENLRLGAYTRGAIACWHRPGPRARRLALFPHPRRGSAGTRLVARSQGASSRCWRLRAHSCCAPSCCSWTSPRWGVAPLLVARIFAAIKQLHAEGLSILLVEQNAALALATASRAYVLETGGGDHDGRGGGPRGG